MSIEAYKAIEESESAEDAIDKLSGSEDWKKDENFSGPVHKFRNGEWWTEDGEKEINVTKKRTDENSTGLEEHMRIVNDLREKKFSVILNDSSEIFSGEEKAAANYKENIHATIYILRGEDIEIHTFHGNQKELKELLQYTDDSMDDDDYSADLRTPVSKGVETTFSLNSSFSSGEKASAKEKVEAGAWESFWKDLLKPTSPEQHVEEPSKGLFEVFGFKANREHQNSQAENAQSDSERSPLNLFTLKPTASGAQEKTAATTLSAKLAEPEIAVLDQQPGLISFPSNEIIRIADNSEPAPLPHYERLAPTNLLQTEASPLYIGEAADGEIEIIATTSRQDAKIVAASPEGKNKGAGITMVDSRPHKRQDNENLSVGIPEDGTRGTEEANIPIKTETRNVFDSAAIRSDEISRDLSGIATALEKSEELTKEEPNASWPDYNEPEVPAVLGHEIFAESQQSKTRVTPRPSEALKIQGAARVVELVSKPVDTSTDRPDALPVEVSEGSSKTDSQNIEETGYGPIQEEFRKEQPLELAQPPIIEAIADDNVSLALDSSPAVIPEFSPQRIPTGENIRDPGPSIISIGKINELSNSKPVENRKIGAKAGTDNNVHILRERVRALKQVMETRETRAKTIIQEKIPVKTPEVSLRRVAAINRQPVLRFKVGSNERQATIEPAMPAQQLEKTRPAVIIRALKNLKAITTTPQTLAENSRAINEAVSISGYRSKTPTGNVYTAKRTNTAKRIASSERFGRQRANQAFQAVTSSNDELITSNTSGIRLAA